MLALMFMMICVVLDHVFLVFLVLVCEVMMQNKNKRKEKDRAWEREAKMEKKMS